MFARSNSKSQRIAPFCFKANIVIKFRSEGIMTSSTQLSIHEIKTRSLLVMQKDEQRIIVRKQSVLSKRGVSVFPIRQLIPALLPAGAKCS